jgi:hypothetical protein
LERDDRRLDGADCRDDARLIVATACRRGVFRGAGGIGFSDLHARSRR